MPEGCYGRQSWKAGPACMRFHEDCVRVEFVYCSLWVVEECNCSAAPVGTHVFESVFFESRH